jgi:hypothetical protein
VGLPAGRAAFFDSFPWTVRQDRLASSFSCSQIESTPALVVELGVGPVETLSRHPQVSPSGGNSANRWVASLNWLGNTFNMQKQRVTIQYLVLVILSLFMVGCYPSMQTQITLTAIPTISSALPTETFVPEPFPTVVSLITPQEALEQMYGNQARIYDSEGSITSAQGFTYKIRINLFTCYWDNLGFEKCLVITDRGVKFDRPSIDGAIFDRTAMGWKLHSFHSDIAKIGTEGIAPKGELIKIGTGKQAVLFKTTYANQGFVTDYLVIIAETENGLGVVFKLTSADKYMTVENQKDVTKWEWNSSLEFQPVTSSDEYYQLVVTYYGTDENGNTPPLQVYRFSGTEYSLFYEQK